MKTADTKKSGPQLSAVKPEEQPKTKTHADILRRLQRDIRAVSTMAEGMWDGLDWMTAITDPEILKSMIWVLEGLMDEALERSDADVEALTALEVTP